MKRKTEASPAELFRVEGIGAKGFGIIPRYAMCDPDLSWHGKVLYAYLCALAGSGNQTWPKKETVIGHLKIGNKTYHAAQKNLLDWGYITIQHTRQGNRQGVNIYTLVSSPPKLSRTAALPPGNEMSNRVISTGLKGAGYLPANAKALDCSNREGADQLNRAMGVTKAQEAAMVAGSMFGWAAPAADPSRYDGDGNPICPGGRRFGEKLATAAEQAQSIQQSHGAPPPQQSMER